MSIMMLAESVPEIAVSVALELSMATIVGVIIYRALAGRFIIPKRHTVLPNQRGVIVQGESVVRVAGPGTAWLRPKQRIIMCDARPRPLQILGLEVIGADKGIVRLSLNGEFHLADPAVYYVRSTSANDAFFAVVRRALLITARNFTSSAIASQPERFAQSIRDSIGGATLQSSGSKSLT